MGSNRPKLRQHAAEAAEEFFTMLDIDVFIAFNVWS
jgi:hypothetical protein